MTSRLIKTSKHYFPSANKQKQRVLQAFIKEARQALQFYIDYLWDNSIEWQPGRVLDISDNKFDVPRFISTTQIPIKTQLSARALVCISNQACGTVKAATRKQGKRIWQREKYLQQGQEPPAKLIEKIKNNPPLKPNACKSNIELSSLCADLKDVKGEFNLFLQLKSIGKAYGKIRIPLKHHRHSHKLLRKGKVLNSFLLSSNSVDIRYELPVKYKTTGQTVGADQGKTDLLTFSNGATTSKKCPHGHSLSSILDNMARKKKGSKAFRRAQNHRSNFIRWSINQLNFQNIKQVNFEQIVNINYGQRTSRVMSHWTNTLIRDKLKDRCLEQEVLVKEQPSAYMSQRCSSCGLVRKANRKGKVYSCKNCGLKIDADLNAARNHEQELKFPSWELRKHIKDTKANLGEGFYWYVGEEPAVPLSKKIPLL